MFKHVRALHMAGAEPAAQVTYLLVASDGPLTWGELKDDDGRALDVREVPLMSVDSTGTELTDHHAPVESLLAPVVRKRADGGLRSRR